MAKPIEVPIRVKGADKAKKQLSKVDKGLASLSKAAAGAAAAFFAAQGLINALRGVIAATEEQILVETQLNSVLKSTQGVAGLTAKELLTMASALQNQTRFGDEAIISAQSLLLTFTKVGKEVFPQALEAILNMSEAMGQDLQSGVIQVGKALNDPILGVTALRRVGVQLTKQQEEQVKAFTKSGEIAKAQKIILSELETQFGGVAKAAGETLGGALAQASNATSDASQALGKELSPIIITISEDIKELANTIENSLPALRSLFQLANAKIAKDGLFGTIFGGIPSVGFNTIVDAALIAAAKQKAADDEIAANNQRRNQEIIDSFLNRDTLIRNAALEHNLAMEALDDEALGVRMDRLQAEFFVQDSLRKRNADAEEQRRKVERDAHKEKIAQNLESAIIQGQTAKDAALSVIKAEVAEAQAGLISSIMKALPFPINLAVAAGAGSLLGKVTDQLLSFQTGGSFVTKGRTTLPIGSGIVVGDNASGMERVDITPLPAPPTTERNITINISAPLVDETVVDTIIPAIRRAEKLNL